MISTTEDLGALSLAKHRITFLFVDRTIVHVDASAVTFATETGVARVPAAALSCLLLGPGTSISHDAVSLLGVSGVSLVWSDAGGTKFFAAGRALNRTSHYAELQAKCFVDQAEHLRIAKALYALRFPDDPMIAVKSLQELRGLEGYRMKEEYKHHSKRTGVPWTRRNFSVDDFAAADTVNQALTVANQLLYGLSHAVLCELGFITSLGFIHCGLEKSFVYDIADIYKAAFAIPVAFDVAKHWDGAMDVAKATRIAMRKEMFRRHLPATMVHDLQKLFSPEEALADVSFASFVGGLWDETGTLPQGVNYATFETLHEDAAMVEAEDQADKEALL